MKPKTYPLTKQGIEQFEKDIAASKKRKADIKNITVLTLLGITYIAIQVATAGTVNTAFTANNALLDGTVKAFKILTRSV